MRVRSALACICIVILFLAVQRYQQLSLAAARAHERLAAAQLALTREQAALRLERSERLRERELTSAALPSRETVREVVRQLLAEAAHTASSAEPTAEAPGRLARLIAGDAETSPALLAQARAILLPTAITTALDCMLPHGPSVRQPMALPTRCVPPGIATQSHKCSDVFTRF